MNPDIDIKDKLRTWLEAELKVVLAKPPLVRIFGFESAADCSAEGSSREILITQGAAKQPDRTPGAPLELRVPRRDVAPNHVRIELREATWYLKNEGDSPVSIFPESDKPISVPVKGGSDTKGLKFRLRIKTCLFEVSAEPVEGVGRIEFGVRATAASDLSDLWFEALGCWFKLRSKKDSRTGIEEHRDRIITSLLRELEKEFGLPQAGPVQVVEQAPVSPARESRAWTITVPIAGTKALFELEIPVEFYKKLRNSTRLIVPGAQTLTLSELNGLNPDMVLVLKSDSALVWDYRQGFDWPLRRKEGNSFVAGEKIRRQVTTEPANDETGPIRVEAFWRPPDADGLLGDLVPGQDLQIPFARIGEVEIAINRKVLGKGKLVRIPYPDGAERWGVQVLSWYVL